MADDPAGLTYFTHEIHGRLFAGWYRRLAGGRVEVFTRTRARTEFLGALTIEAQACHILEALVAEDELAARPDDELGSRSGSDPDSKPMRRKK